MSFDFARVLNGPQPVTQLLEKIEEFGGMRAYVVGGYVRDSLLGYNVNDADIDILVHLIDATTDQVDRLEQFLVGTWDLKKVTKAHGDVVYTNQKLEVTLTHDLFTNLDERDLTINAIAVDRFGEVRSTALGLKDLEQRVFRAPKRARTLQMDPYRFVRYARFASDMPEFAFDPDFLRVIKQKEWFSPLSFPTSRDDRMGQEIMKLLRSRNPARGLRLIAEWDLLDVPFPGLKDIDYPQDPMYHDFDVKEHTLRVLEHLRGQPPHVLLAALYHDAGKSYTATREGRRIHFYGHEKRSAQIAEDDLDRLGYSNELIARVKGLILEHMNLTSPSTRAVRRLMSRLAEHGVNIRELIALRTADMKGQRVDWPRYVDQELMDAVAVTADHVERQGHALTVNDLKINGDDIMAVLGLKPGPEIGEIKRQLLDMVLNDPTLNTREKLMELLRTGAYRQGGNDGER